MNLEKIKMGEVAEWLKAAVLKTVRRRKASPGFESQLLRSPSLTHFRA